MPSDGLTEHSQLTLEMDNSSFENAPLLSRLGDELPQQSIASGDRLLLSPQKAEHRQRDSDQRPDRQAAGERVLCIGATHRPAAKRPSAAEMYRAGDDGQAVQSAAAPDIR